MLIFVSLDTDGDERLSKILTTFNLITLTGLDFILGKFFLQDTRSILVFGGKLNSPTLVCYKYDMELTIQEGAVQLLSKTEMQIEELAKKIDPSESFFAFFALGKVFFLKTNDDGNQILQSCLISLSSSQFYSC